MPNGLVTLARKAVALVAKALQLQPLSGRAGWWTVVREAYTGAWQRNDEIRQETVLAYSAVFACTTLIPTDIGKMTLRLVQQDDDGIWEETENPAFSPVLRKPNRYQTTGKYVEQYISSKLIHGNTYVLKERDGRGMVRALYVLDPTRVTPLVAQDGSVYYELKRDDISGLQQETVTVPASEIIHDTMIALYHPLIGVSPLYACGMAATQGLAIQKSSTKLFQNKGVPGGLLLAPTEMPLESAQRIKATWQQEFTGDNAGNVAILTGGMQYKEVTFNPVEMALVDQLKWTGETVASCYHVPAYMVGIGPPPPYANIGPLIQQYFSQCLQGLIKNFEDHHDHGLGLGPEYGNRYGVEFDINDLIWMDAETKTKAASDAIGSGALAIDEARKDYFGKGPVTGGDTPYLQEQNYSLAALAKRDANDPFAKPAPAPTPAPREDDAALRAASLASLIHQKSLEVGLYAA